jgi:hypothetical protein
MAERYNARRLNDRKDGRRLRTLSPVFQLTPFIMRHPSDAVHSFSDSAEISSLEQWILARRADGYEDMSLLHVFIAAYIRMVAHRPAVNRFVAGRFLYARDFIDVVLSTGRNGSADAGALTVKVRFVPTDTIYDVCRKISAQVDSLKADEETSRVEALADTLVKTPRFVIRGGTAVLRWLDYHGWLGEKWTDKSPFHGSLVISDEGLSALPPVSRSLNSMGSLPLSISIGRRRNTIEVSRAGELMEKKYVDYAVTMDARIADTAYLGTAFKYFRHYLANPDLLEKGPERVNEDAL